MNVHPSLLPEFAGGMDLQVGNTYVTLNDRIREGDWTIVYQTPVELYVPPTLMHPLICESLPPSVRLHLAVPLSLSLTLSHPLSLSLSLTLPSLLTHTTHTTHTLALTHTFFTH